MMCHADEPTAIERGIDGAHFFGFSLAYYYAFGEHRPGPHERLARVHRRRDEVGFAREIVTPDDAPLGVRLLQEGLGSLRGAIGTPEQIADLFERYEAAGVDQVIFVSQAGHEPPRAHLREPRAVRRRGHAELRGAGRRSASAAKDERLAGAVERALARRPPAAHRRPGLRGQARRVSPRRPAALAGGRRDGPRRRATPVGARAGGARGRGGLAGLVRNRTDAQLHRLFDRGPGLAVIFKGMERASSPSGRRASRARSRTSCAGATARGVDGPDPRRPARPRAAAGRGSGRHHARQRPRLRAHRRPRGLPPKLLLEGARARGRLRARRPPGEMFGGAAHLSRAEEALVKAGVSAASQVRRRNRRDRRC